MPGACSFCSSRGHSSICARLALFCLAFVGLEISLGSTKAGPLGYLPPASGNQEDAEAMAFSFPSLSGLPNPGLIVSFLGLLWGVSFFDMSTHWLMWLLKWTAKDIYPCWKLPIAFGRADLDVGNPGLLGASVP